MKIRGADFVMYPVSDLARAASFYREVLGLQQELYNEEWKWAEFNCGNVTLALKGGTARPKEAGGACIALAVDDVQKAHEALKQQGVRVVSEPQDFTVCWAMEILDPDGNSLMLHRRADGTVGQDSAVS